MHSGLPSLSLALGTTLGGGVGTKHVPEGHRLEAGGPGRLTTRISLPDPQVPSQVRQAAEVGRTQAEAASLLGAPPSPPLNPVAAASSYPSFSRRRADYIFQRAADTQQP